MYSSILYENRPWPWHNIQYSSLALRSSEIMLRLFVGSIYSNQTPATGMTKNILFLEASQASIDNATTKGDRLQHRCSAAYPCRSKARVCRRMYKDCFSSDSSAGAGENWTWSGNDGRFVGASWWKRVPRGKYRSVERKRGPLECQMVQK